MDADAFLNDLAYSGPWLEVEVADTLEVLDWIVAQSWSNGKVRNQKKAERGGEGHADATR